MRAFNALSSILSPSRRSMPRLVLPSRLELKRREGSSNRAPFAKVILPTLLYVSPVHMIPACDQTGTPLHFHSSTTSGSACLMRDRIRASVLPLQSPSSLILASISREAERGFSSLALVFFFFMVAFFCFVRCVGVLSSGINQKLRHKNGQTAKISSNPIRCCAQRNDRGTQLLWSSFPDERRKGTKRQSMSTAQSCHRTVRLRLPMTRRSTNGLSNVQPAQLYRAICLAAIRMHAWTKVSLEQNCGLTSIVPLVSNATEKGNFSSARKSSARLNFYSHSGRRKPETISWRSYTPQSIASASTISGSTMIQR